MCSRAFLGADYKSLELFQNSEELLRFSVGNIVETSVLEVFREAFYNPELWPSVQGFLEADWE